MPVEGLTEVTIEQLLEHIEDLDFARLSIVVRWLVTDRQGLKLRLQEAEAVNEEWRQGIDRLGQELASAKVELAKQTAAGKL
jgi:hypothetical protein